MKKAILLSLIAFIFMDSGLKAQNFNAENSGVPVTGLLLCCRGNDRGTFLVDGQWRTNHSYSDINQVRSIMTNIQNAGVNVVSIDMTNPSQWTRSWDEYRPMIENIRTVCAEKNMDYFIMIGAVVSDAVRNEPGMPAWMLTVGHLEFWNMQAQYIWNNWASDSHYRTYGFGDNRKIITMFYPGVLVQPLWDSTPAAQKNYLSNFYRGTNEYNQDFQNTASDGWGYRDTQQNLDGNIRFVCPTAGLLPYTSTHITAQDWANRIDWAAGAAHYSNYGSYDDSFDNIHWGINNTQSATTSIQVKYPGDDPYYYYNILKSKLATKAAKKSLGFESPVLSASPGYVYRPAGGTWAFTGDSGIVTNGGGFGNAVSPQGVQAGFLQGAGSIQQTINFATAGTYKVNVKAAQRPSNNQTFKVYADGNLIGTINPSSTSYLTYTTNNFAITAGNHIIKLTGTNPLGGDNSAFIDDIGIILVTSNLGFETPVIPASPGFVYRPTGGPFTFTGTSGIVRNGGGFGNSNVPEGSQACFLQQSGYIEQVVYFPVNSSYKINFKAAQRNGNTQTLAVYIDGNWIGTITPSSTSYLTYSTNNYSVSAGNHTVKFAGTNPLGGDNTVYVDDLQIQDSNYFGKKASTEELLDIKDFKDLQLTVYPNPCNEYTNIGFNLEHASVVHFDLYSLSGAKVISLSQLYDSGKNEMKLSVDNLVAGIYILNMTTDSYAETLKIIIQ